MMEGGQNSSTGLTLVILQNPRCCSQRMNDAELKGNLSTQGRWQRALFIWLAAYVMMHMQLGWHLQLQC